MGRLKKVSGVVGWHMHQNIATERGADWMDEGNVGAAGRERNVPEEINRIWTLSKVTVVDTL